MLKNSLCKLSKRHIHYRVNYNQNSKNSCQFAAFLNKHAFFGKMHRTMNYRHETAQTLTFSNKHTLFRENVH